MFLDKMNRTELGILELVLDKALPEKLIAAELERSPSWISECVHHLVDMGFLSLGRNGISRIIRISDNGLGASLRRLMKENRMLDYDLILPNSGLIILPLLLEPGTNMDEICRRTRLTSRTVHYRLRDWKSIGLIDLGKYPKSISLSGYHPNLSNFLVEYCKHRNRRFLNKTCPEGDIVWEWRDEFLFSTSGRMDDINYLPAGVTRLHDFGVELVHTYEYYHFSIGKESVTLEESLVQTVRTDPMNPRPIRIVREMMGNGMVNRDVLFDIAKKYDVHKTMKTRL